MTDEQEQYYELGQKALLQEQLKGILRQLGDYENHTKELLIAEREATIVTLREICAEFGDNDWEDDLHLRDILTKHLLPYLTH